MTNELLARLDGKTRDYETPAKPYESFLDQIYYLVNKTRRDRDDPASPWKIDITATDHGGLYESFISHADIGLVIDFETGEGKGAPRRAVYLLQAKRLYPYSRESGTSLYNPACRFRELNEH